MRDFSPEGLAVAVEGVLARTGLGYLDATILDDPNAEELSPQALDMLKRLKDMGRIRLLGVTGARRRDRRLHLQRRLRPALHALQPGLRLEGAAAR